MCNYFMLITYLWKPIQITRKDGGIKVFFAAPFAFS